MKTTASNQIASVPEGTPGPSGLSGKTAARSDVERLICETCGTRVSAAALPDDVCPICMDDRQFVPAEGQGWTTMQTLSETHSNQIEELEPGLWGIDTAPRFGIGQRALLVQTPRGNLLWDCITLLDDTTRRRIGELGGIRTIAVSHPHYYGSMALWAETFDAEILLHADDAAWVLDSQARVTFWAGEDLHLPGGLSLHRLGGHFPGAQILQWPRGAEGRGALLVGDVVQIAADPAWVSFMYSYPNYIPLPADTVRRIGARVQGLRFDRLYGAWRERVVRSGARDVVRRSVDRYTAAIEGRFKPRTTPPVGSRVFQESRKTDPTF